MSVEPQVVHEHNHDVASMFATILGALRAGPQCPCTLALRAAEPERHLYPYLAELLARGWVTVITESQVRASTRAHDEWEAASATADFVEREVRTTEAEISRCECIQDPRERLAEKTRTWFAFFRRLAPQQEQRWVAFYLAITKDGLSAMSRLQA